MYLPQKYKKTDKDYIFQFIKNHPFATLVSQGQNLVATHIPIQIKGDANQFKLVGHIANHNSQLQYLNKNTEVLLIFQGAQGYISSSWYREKDISTWDYSAVHVNAKIKLQTETELRNSLEKLVEQFEEKQETPLYYHQIPAQMLEDHIPQITGFWCEPFKIEAVAKLHQNFGQKDTEAVIKKLKNSDKPLDKCLAEDIRKENHLK